MKIQDILRQYEEGAITYGEFMRAILWHFPPPCDDVQNDRLYGPLAKAIETVVNIEQAVFADGSL